MAVKKRRRKKNSNAYIVASWALTLFFVYVFYLLFCGFIGNKRFFANTNISGIDVSKMTVNEAAKAVEEQFKSTYKDTKITVLLNGKKLDVDISGALNMDVTDAVQNAMDACHGYSSRGVNYFKSFFKESSYQAKPSLKNKKTLTEAIDRSGIKSKAGNDKKSYTIGDKYVTVTKGRGGYEIDEDKLVLSITDAILKGDYSCVIECPLLYSDVNIQAIYDEVYVEPQNPSLDKDNNYEIIPAKTGVSIDLEKAQKLMDQAKDGQEVQIELIFTEPEMTTAQFNESLFRDVLGSYSTSVSGTDDRRTNVRLAAENCNGTILLPGESFSFNNVVGQRTLENGFKEAPSYVNGESVNEVGGGICQVSSTLYNACLYSNLKINERHCHPHASSYVPAGFDATVSWGGPDYIFSNDTDFPIKVVSGYDGAYVSCIIYGTIDEHFSVELSSETINVVPYKTEYEDDETLEEGEEKVSVSGMDGFTVQTYRKVYNSNGELIYEGAESTSVYSKQDEVILKGTMEKESDEDYENGKKKKKKKKDKSEDTETENGEASTEASTEAATETPETDGAEGAE